jgi:peptidoglycan hydrolase-like protein with peptidoglycan-binding domain
MRAPAFLRALAPRSKRAVAGAALVALMIGIVVNAVALQHGRRVELTPEPAALAPVKPAALAAVKPVAPAPAPVAAPTPPQPSPATAATRAERNEDPIAAFLRQNGPDKRKLTLAAQTALGKLGYTVRATGALDAETKSALSEFEKKHKLPVTAEITPKLVKTISAADE